MFDILPRDWNLKPIFTQKWASVDMNCGVQPPDNSNPAYRSEEEYNYEVNVSYERWQLLEVSVLFP